MRTAPHGAERDAAEWTFLEVLPTGEVREDKASPTSMISRSRFGDAAPLDMASSAPRWTTVSLDGTRSWHDHRAHWMSEARPAGRQPGERILQAVIPLIVDGRRTEVTVVSTWMPAPSPTPIVARIAAALMVVIVGLLFRRLVDVVVAVLAISAWVVGWWQYISAPGDTGPSAWPWVLPAIAIAATAPAVAVRRRSPLLASALLVLGSVELALWAWQRRTVLSRAILPTDAPWWLDRTVTVAVLVAGVLLAAGCAVHLMRAGGPRQGGSAGVPVVADDLQ